MSTQLAYISAPHAGAHYLARKGRRRNLFWSRITLEYEHPVDAAEVPYRIRIHAYKTLERDRMRA